MASDKERLIGTALRACLRTPNEATYGGKIDEFRKWLQGINHSVKEI